MNIAEKDFLIIAGQPKAGTTTLFSWLQQHKQITASIAKETRFFLDEGYPLPRASGYNGHNLQAYAEVFLPSAGSVFMEATPDYLYCNTPLEIAALLPRAKVVLVLREASSRVVSCYRFFQQRGDIPSSMSFDEYMKKQALGAETAQADVAFRALDHCRSAHYVGRFRAAFGARLLVLDFEDVKARPEAVFAEICAFAGLEAPESSIDFGVKNRTSVARSPALMRFYNRFRAFIAHRTQKMPLLRKMLSPLSRKIRKGLLQNKAPAQTEMSPENAAILRQIAEA